MLCIREITQQYSRTNSKLLWAVLQIILQWHTFYLDLLLTQSFGSIRQMSNDDLNICNKSVGHHYPDLSYPIDIITFSIQFLDTIFNFSLSPNTYVLILSCTSVSRMLVLTTHLNRVDDKFSLIISSCCSSIFPHWSFKILWGLANYPFSYVELTKNYYTKNHSLACQ